MLLAMCLTRLAIYQGAVAPNCFKSHRNSGCPDFCQKKALSDVWSEIHLFRRNIVYAGTY